MPTKAKPRTPAVTDPKQIKGHIVRLAKKYGWTPVEFTQYVLRMGLNRCLALERFGKAPVQRAKPKKRAKKGSKG